MRRFLLLAVLAFFAVPAGAEDGFPFDLFPESSFAKLMADEAGHEADMANAPVGSHIFHPALRARVVAQYQGTHRPLSSQRLKHIADFAKAYRIDDAWRDEFREEYLFKAEGSDWWLPVQQQVASHFKEDLPKGKLVDLYLIYGGAQKAEKGWSVLFLVEEYQRHP